MEILVGIISLIAALITIFLFFQSYLVNKKKKKVKPDPEPPSPHVEKFNDEVKNLLSSIKHAREIDGFKMISDRKLMGALKDGKYSQLDDIRFTRLKFKRLNIHDIIFNNSDIRECEFSKNSWLERVYFYLTKMSGINFSNSILKNCEFKGSTLTRVRFESVKFVGSLVGQVKSCENVVFKKCIFEDCQKGAVAFIFPGAEIINCQFKKTT